MNVQEMIEPKGESPLGWFGGKTKLRSTIINSFPLHHAYVEIFGGSATVFFGKPPEMSQIEVINDVHEDLVNLMRVISGVYFDESIRQEFIGYVRGMPGSRSLFELWKKWDRELIDALSPAQRAFRFYYLVKNGFSSNPTCGFSASPFSQSRYNQLTDFEPFTARFQSRSAQIENMDFRALVEKYNKTDERKKVFFFADPPYFVADDTKYYEHVFNHQDHLDFKGLMDTVDAASNAFLITYDDHPDVIRLYSEYYIYRTAPVIYQASDEYGERDNAKSELFITNYDIKDAILHRDKSLIHAKRGRQIGDMFEAKTSDDVIKFPEGYDLTLMNKPSRTLPTRGGDCSIPNGRA
jgi:DNA adenine methylase